MNIHNTDFAFIGLTVARIASQLREKINLNATFSFGTELGTYAFISLFDGDECMESFHLSRYECPRKLMDEIFAFCVEKDLFKVPMDIAIID